MTREEIILGLLAADGAASRAELMQDTGWGIVDTNEVVDRLMEDGRVVLYPRQQSKKLLCLPEMRVKAMANTRDTHPARAAEAT